MIRRAARLGLVLLAALALAGCATTLGKLRRAVRQPGEKLAALPEAVEKQYDCTARALPFFELERNEINPDRLEPGSEFNHRMVYALCPRNTTEVVVGDLHTRIRFRGHVIVDERVPRFELKPGRWVVDAFVRLPDEAETGIYALEVSFESAAVHVDESLTFGVERE